MTKTGLYIASALISIFVLISVGVLSWHELIDHDVLRHIFMSPWIALLGWFLIPRGDQPSSRVHAGVTGLALAALLASSAYFFAHETLERAWHMLSPITIGTVFFAAGMLTIELIKFAHRRWTEIRLPRTRLVVGIAALAAIATLGLLALIWVIFQVDWHSVFVNWDLVLVLAYLPVVGGIAGLFYLRRVLEKRKSDTRDRM